MSVELNCSNSPSGKSSPKTLIIIGMASLAAMLVITFVVVHNIDSKSKSRPESDSGGYLHELSEANIRARMTVSMTNLKQMYQALAVYQIDNNQYPNSLDDMTDVLPAEALINPFDKTIPYVYIEPKEPQNMGDIVFYDPLVVKGAVRVAYVDGSVCTLPVGEFKGRLAKQGVESKLIEK